jgi:hypothetical protein
MSTLDSYMTALVGILNGGDRSTLADYCEPDADLEIAAVYRNGFMKTCVEVLKSNYPVVMSLVGEEYFLSLANLFVQKHPPRQGSLTGYGLEFPEEIEACISQHQLPYLADIACLDRAWFECYFAADGHSLSGDDINKLQTDVSSLTALPMSLVPWAQMVKTQFDVADVWTTLKHQGQLNSNVNIEPYNLTILVWRKQGVINLRPLTMGEQEFLAAVRRRETLGTAAEAALDADPEFDLTQYFATFLQQRILQQKEHE